ncbi:hypothetical protein B0T21DRAFT_344414 [Apiosordaria backusii]|uniref:Uncharacterized protein n=1 Tax=Apiosordaria backusii TaxID=314023 RepID=A0AA40F0L8_9PEZI|nr:hypothetical protein B0T21DRAFT_344414 [Apiosordaria backusii]
MKKSAADKWSRPLVAVRAVQPTLPRCRRCQQSKVTLQTFTGRWGQKLQESTELSRLSPPVLRLPYEAPIAHSGSLSSYKVAGAAQHALAAVEIEKGSARPGARMTPLLSRWRPLYQARFGFLELSWAAFVHACLRGNGDRYNGEANPALPLPAWENPPKQRRDTTNRNLVEGVVEEPKGDSMWLLRSGDRRTRAKLNRLDHVEI